MKKIFMDRTVPLETTIKKQIDYISKLFDYDLDIISTPNNIFYTSQIKIKNLDPSIVYQFTAGKGLSKNECLASNYGELIERHSWQIFRNKLDEDDSFKIKALNLYTNKIEIFESKNLMAYEGRSDYIASGNNFFEAIYHAITEAYEYGLLNSYYPYVPIKYTILDIKKLYPTCPDYFNDNYVILLRQDERLPLYDITAFKLDKNNFMPLSIKNDNGNVIFQKIVNHFSSSVGDRPDEEPWPPISGSRAGLNLEKVIKLAIAEQIQSHYLLKLNNYIDYDIEFNDNINKTKNSIYNYDDAVNFKNNETETLEEDVFIIVEALHKIGFNMWVIDITPKDCPMKVIKLITDYSIGKDNPHSSRLLKNFFNI